MLFRQFLNWRKSGNLSLNVNGQSLQRRLLIQPVCKPAQNIPSLCITGTKVARLAVILSLNKSSTQRSLNLNVTLLVECHLQCIQKIVIAPTYRIFIGRMRSFDFCRLKCARHHSNYQTPGKLILGIMNDHRPSSSSNRSSTVRKRFVFRCLLDVRQ